jgi:hypothetical protein
LRADGAAGLPTDAAPPSAPADGAHQARDPNGPARLAFAVYAAICALAWGAAHTYRGIVHDARLYTLQALAHLHPTSLGFDVFLRYGSQDRFTLWSPLYAAAIERFGLEPAAALLTATSQIAVIAAAWLLVRRLAPARFALLGLAVLIAIPGDYGPDRIFTVIEAFSTPRMAAEALVLAALGALWGAREAAAAVWGAREAAAAMCLALALALHPIIAAPGVGLWLWSHARARPERRRSIALWTALLAACLLTAGLATGMSLRFDAEWLALVRGRSPYLFLSGWRAADWNGAGLVAAILIVGRRAAPTDAGRRLCGAVLALFAAGIVLTGIGADALQLVAVTQAQPWRAEWLATAVAALLLPAIVGARWRAGPCGRITALALLAAAVFGADVPALLLLAVLLFEFAAPKLPTGALRGLLGGAWGLLGLAVTWRLAVNLQGMSAYYLDPEIPLWARRATSLMHDGSVPVGLAAASLWFGAHTSSHPMLGRAVLGACLIATAAAAAVLLPAVWQPVHFREFPRARIEQFAAARTRLPERAEVFWPEAPLGAWVLLERPSFLSMLQTSGVVFSRASALELRRRAAALEPGMASSAYLVWREGAVEPDWSDSQLRAACQTQVFDYLVTNRDLGSGAPAAVVPARGSSERRAPSTADDLRIYQCAPEFGSR